MSAYCSRAGKPISKSARLRNPGIIRETKAFRCGGGCRSSGYWGGSFKRKIFAEALFNFSRCSLCRGNSRGKSFLSPSSVIVSRFIYTRNVRVPRLHIKLKALYDSQYWNCVYVCVYVCVFRYWMTRQICTRRSLPVPIIMLYEISIQSIYHS